MQTLTRGLLLTEEHRPLCHITLTHCLLLWWTVVSRHGARAQGEFTPAPEGPPIRATHRVKQCTCKEYRNVGHRIQQQNVGDHRIHSDNKHQKPSGAPSQPNHHISASTLYKTHQEPLKPKQRVHRFQTDPSRRCPGPAHSHQFVLGVRQVRLLVAVVVGRPAVGHQEEEDGRVVGDLRTGPADHQGAAVHVLHLHVEGGAAAH